MQVIRPPRKPNLDTLGLAAYPRSRDGRYTCVKGHLLDHSGLCQHARQSLIPVGGLDAMVNDFDHDCYCEIAPSLPDLIVRRRLRLRVGPSANANSA